MLLPAWPLLLGPCCCHTVSPSLRLVFAVPLPVLLAASNPLPMLLLVVLLPPLRLCLLVPSLLLLLLLLLTQLLGVSVLLLLVHTILVATSCRSCSGVCLLFLVCRVCLGRLLLLLLLYLWLLGWGGCTTAGCRVGRHGRHMLLLLTGCHMLPFVSVAGRTGRLLWWLLALGAHCKRFLRRTLSCAPLGSASAPLRVVNNTKD
jgi:hypothetical protein